MFRVCDVDALMTPGQAVYYVIKQLDPEHGKVEPEIVDAPLPEVSHREVDMIIVHDFLDKELNVPVISYAVKEKTSFEPIGFIAIPVEEFTNVLEFDTDTTSLEVHGSGNLVSAMNITRDDSGHVTVNLETADQMVQYIPPRH